MSCNCELKQCVRNRYLLLSLIFWLHFLAVLVLGSSYHIVTDQPLFQIHLYIIKIIITQQIFRSENIYATSFKKNPEHPFITEALIYMLEACFYKSQGFCFFVFLIINCCDFWGQLIKTYSVTVNKSTRNHTLGFLACTFAFAPEREVLQMETGENQSTKKKPKTTHKKKTKQTKWGQNSNGRTATSETSQLIALGSALHGSARFCLINLSNLFLFFFVLSPPPSDPFTHTRTHTLHPNHPLSSSLSPLSPHLPLSQTRKNIPEHRCSSHLRGAFTRPIAGWHFVSQFSACFSQRDLLSYGIQWAKEKESQAS